MNLTSLPDPRIFLRRIPWRAALLCAIASVVVQATAQEVTLPLDPAKSTVKFTLSDVLHTVHGTFTLKKGTLHFDSTSGKVSGEIVVDARSGESGNGVRDRKMHKEILESDRFPEISFRPTLVEGAAASGKSSAKVHGMFSIHGVEREITVPAEVEIESDHWSANVHFTIPYEKWGMKNPSTLFLRVSDSVEIDLAAAGSVER
ncbi:MAG: YceI family protein [Candidatus Sulfotelmatobacter sp.]